MSVCACSILRNVEIQNKRFERASPPPYQARDSGVSGRHESTANCLHTQVGKHARTGLRAQLQVDRHKNTQHRQKQRNLPTYTDSFTLVSLDSVPSTICRHVAAFSQWCAQMSSSHPQFRQHEPCLIRYKRGPSRSILPLPTFTTRPSYSAPTPPQRCHRNPKRSSAARLMLASHCPRKEIAPTAHIGRWGSGTSLV